MVGHRPDSCGGFVLLSETWDQTSVLPRLGAHADKSAAALAKIYEDPAVWASPKALPEPASRPCMHVERKRGHHGWRKTMAGNVSLARPTPPTSGSRSPTMVARRRSRRRSVSAPVMSSGGAARIYGKFEIDPGPRAPSDLLTPAPSRSIPRGWLLVYSDPANRPVTLREAPDLKALVLLLNVVRVAELEGV